MKAHLQVRAAILQTGIDYFIIHQHFIGIRSFVPTAVFILLFPVLNRGSKLFTESYCQTRDCKVFQTAPWLIALLWQWAQYLPAAMLQIIHP